MASSIPEKALVALSESPDLFARGEYHIVDPAKAKVSAFDRSFHFGDSIYEVARTYEGVIFGLEEHMTRMEASLKLAAFEEMPDFNLLRRMILDASKAFVKKFGHLDIYIRWMVSRGCGDLNILRSVSSKPYGFVFIKELAAPTAEDFEKGMHYAIVSRIRNHPNAVDPHMKSGNYINNILALSEAKALGAQDGILLDHRGYITEGTTNNVYMVKSGEVYTSPDHVGILEGITRNYIYRAANMSGIKLHEKLMTADEFAAGDELFMSSSIKEIQPITTLNGKPVNGGKPGPVTRKLAETLMSIIRKNIESRRHETLFN